MQALKSICLAGFFVAFVSTLGLAVETGDFDGDGQLTLADVALLKDGATPVPGSLEGFEVFPCFEPLDPQGAYSFYLEEIVPGMVYLESLRRRVAGSYANWASVWTE